LNVDFLLYQNTLLNNNLFQNLNSENIGFLNNNNNQIINENYDVYKQSINHPEITFQSKVVLIDLQSYAAYDIFSNATAVTWSN